MTDSAPFNFQTQPLALQQTNFDNLPTLRKPKGGMFGGSTGNIIAAALAGFVSRQNPAILQNLMAAQAQRRNQAQEEDQYKRHRQDSVSDWITQQTWKQAHPDPINNDTVNDYQFISKQLGPEAGKRYLDTKTNPIVMTPYGPMPYSAVNPQAPTAPVGRLTPIDEGGQGLGGPGGFR